MLFHKREQGQGMVEYALLLILCVFVIIAIVTTMGGAVQKMYNDIVTAFPIR